MGVRQTDAVSHIIDLLADNNLEIRKMADQALELIMEMDDELGKRIRHRKFVVHNQEWWQKVTGGYEEQADELPMQEQQAYTGGPYQGYSYQGDSEEEDYDIMMMDDDGTGTMDAYGDTGYLHQGYQQNGAYYADDPDI